MSCNFEFDYFSRLPVVATPRATAAVSATGEGINVRDMVVFIECEPEERVSMKEAGIQLKSQAEAEDILQAGLAIDLGDEEMVARSIKFPRIRVVVL